MPAPLLALIAALGFGVSAVLLKRGLQNATPLAAAMVSVIFTVAFLWLLAALNGALPLMLSPKIVPFLVAGLLAPGLARLVLFMGVDRIGVARSSSLAACTPLFAVAMAVIALGERPTWGQLAGALSIVGGGVLLSYRTEGERAWRRRDMIFPLLAALGFALRDNISRPALREYPHPLVAAAAAAICSLVVMSLVAMVQRENLGVGRAGLGYLALAGLAEGVAYLTMWPALALAPVSVVSPLVNAFPIFAVALTAVFLRDLERVTWRMIVAAVLVVAGVTAIVRFGST